MASKMGRREEASEVESQMKQVIAGGEVERQGRRQEVAGGDQGAADCRQPQGNQLQLQGTSGLDQLHRRGNTLAVNPFFVLQSKFFFCQLIVLKSH